MQAPPRQGRTPNHYSRTEFNYRTEWMKRKKGEKKTENEAKAELVRSFCGLKREVWRHTEPLELVTTPSVCI